MLSERSQVKHCIVVNGVWRLGNDNTTISKCDILAVCCRLSCPIHVLHRNDCYCDGLASMTTIGRCTIGLYSQCTMFAALIYLTKGAFRGLCPEWLICNYHATMSGSWPTTFFPPCDVFRLISLLPIQFCNIFINIT